MTNAIEVLKNVCSYEIKASIKPETSCKVFERHEWKFTGDAGISHPPQIEVKNNGNGVFENVGIDTFSWKHFEEKED